MGNAACHRQAPHHGRPRRAGCLHAAPLLPASTVQFLSTVANQVAGALENARLFRAADTALTARVAELSALEEIARLL